MNNDIATKILTELKDIKSEQKAFRTELSGIHDELSGIKSEQKSIRTELKDIKSEQKSINDRLNNIESEQKSIRTELRDVRETLTDFITYQEEINANQQKTNQKILNYIESANIHKLEPKVDQNTFRILALEKAVFDHD